MNDFKIGVGAVYGRKTIPEEGVTVFDEIKWEEELYALMKDINIYKRSPHDCLRGEGNWVCIVIFTDGDIISFELPRKMSYKKVMDYYRPLIAKIRKFQ